MKKILAAICVGAAVLMSGCSSTDYNAMVDYDFAEMNTDFVQLKMPEEGDTIAIIDTDLGEIRVVIYDELCPNTAKAFIDNANNGIYNDKSIYGVMEDCYFLSGGFENESGNYTGRNSDDELIANECTSELWPFKGALLSFSEKSGYGDSRWFICNDDKESLTEDNINELKQAAAEEYEEDECEKLIELFDAFYTTRGVFGLSGMYTVFGQTYEGLDVVEALCNIAADEYYRPTEDCKIKSVTITQYMAEE